ncbi:MAG: HEAT repeat domain-containing protein [Gemmataceae bacterium]
MMRRYSFALLLIGWLSVPLHAEHGDLGLRVAPGFRVTVYAGPELANDIQAMTLDKQGRVVVTSRGWVKRLHDTNGDGNADQAEVIATTPRGGLGMTFDGDDLLFAGDGWLSRYRIRQGQVADRPERIAPLAHGEHGGHIMRQGPDGCWYLIGGNDTGFTPERHNNRPHPLMRHFEAGGILRFGPDWRQSEVIACGYRNPYRFDFNEWGDLFVYDSDTERDFFLPWYAPTRLYHVLPGAHHGWRLEGYLRSWCRPDYFLDNVAVLAPLGRGSPTGVVCYRHHQFPEHYRGGLFLLDWTFGRVYYCPLRRDGASYTTKPEIFIEATGTSGFNPTDAVVAPDGALLVSMGGRGTRGTVFRVEYVGEEGTAPPRSAPPRDDLEAVLHAPQPLEAWSRQQWQPLAQKLGRDVFLHAAADEQRADAPRIRALEIVTDLFGGIPLQTAEKIRSSPSAPVRARLAWSLGRRSGPQTRALLAPLANDDDARVRLCALIALTEQFPNVPAESVRQAVTTNLGHDDKRVVQAAANLTARLPEADWQTLQADGRQAAVRARLGGVLATLWREPDADHTAAVVPVLLSVLQDTKDSELQLHAVRLLQVTLGDYCLRNPPAEVFTGYALQRPLAGKEKWTDAIRIAVRRLFPAPDDRLNLEASRLLAMLQADDEHLVSQVAEFWTEDSPPTRDVHYLCVLARLRGRWPEALPGKVAGVVLNLHRKLHGQEQRDKQNWNMRLVELTTAMQRHEPRLADALLRDPRLTHGAHVPLVLSLPPSQRKQAAEKFLAIVSQDNDWEWTGQLVQLLQELPAERVRPLLRAQWENFGLRDAIITQLARTPEEQDRSKFLEGLDSAQPHVLRACLTALAQLPRDAAADHLVPLLALQRRLFSEPNQAPLRQQTLALLNRQAGQSFVITEQGTRPEELQNSYRPLFDWFEDQHPRLTAKLYNADGEDPEYWRQLLAQVDWSKGDSARGARLYTQRACVTCHAGSSRIGPDLTGVASRFSRQDLFDAIIFPSRDVAPAYRTETFFTKSGQLFTGIVVFYSADGYILQTDASTTVRVATDDIELRHPSNRSLMPAGLLKDLKPDDLADLYSYLLTLKSPMSAGKK